MLVLATVLQLPTQAGPVAVPNSGDAAAELHAYNFKKRTYLHTRPIFFSNVAFAVAFVAVFAAVAQASPVAIPKQATEASAHGLEKRDSV
ncbi:hypothetical protein CPB97_010137 [Podila verticillata]|nr:hypothetical protein CPB97_010137 [Podila verticillata]